MEEVIYRVEDLTKLFPVKTGLASSLVGKPLFVHAVNSVNFNIHKGEIFGMVGESGCGKTTTGRLLIRLEDPTKGKMYFEGTDIATLKGKKLKEFRRNVQMVFQDPYESLNPRFSVFATVSEPLIVHNIGETYEEKVDMVCKALEYAELKPPEEFLQRFPHELSGGQRQRVAVARTLVLRPKFIVADEPVSMLDVSIRAGIMNLMLGLREEHHIPFMFISHDVSVTRYMSHRIAVMYLGNIVELSETEDLIKNPLHPYTQALLSAVPVPDPTAKHGRIKIIGDLPSPINLPKGCVFHPRCLYKKDICKRIKPELREVGKDHFVQCHFGGEIVPPKFDDEFDTEELICERCKQKIGKDKNYKTCDCPKYYHENCAMKLEKCPICNKKF
jgi:peptide/nickel transport system ATP-binding protein